MARPVSLSVHRNTVERRRSRDLVTDVRKAVNAIMSNDIRAYAFVAIDAQGRAHASWDTGATMPMWAFPATVGEIVRRDMEDSGVEEDWKPSLPAKGSTEHG